MTTGVTLRVSVLTPTRDRPHGIALAERWMAHQTRPPDEWIIVDDGLEPAPLTQGQIHLRRAAEPGCGGAQSLCRNLLWGLPRVTGDVLVFWEDDDYYAPTHLERILAQLQRPGVLIAGDDQQRYYNVAHRRWRIFKNRGACLCQTAIRRDGLAIVERAACQSLSRRSYGVDAGIWSLMPRHAKALDRTGTVVGIKGLPGQPGLGVGHRPIGPEWQADLDGRVLREWIGPDAAVYHASGQPALRSVVTS